MSEVLSEKEVVTKKDHACFACCRTFPAGTKMTHQTNIIDGDFCSVYTCQTCKKLLMIARDELIDDDHNFPERCVREAVYEARLKTPEEWLNVLTQEAQP